MTQAIDHALGEELQRERAGRPIEERLDALANQSKAETDPDGRGRSWRESLSRPLPHGGAR